MGTLGVEASTPALVGEWYLHSRSAHRDAQVIEAYRQLQTETDHLFTLLTGDVCTKAIRVAFTRCTQPYESDEELIFAVRTNGTLEITSAATAGERLHPLLDCAFGGAFDRFRAVHDLIGHAWCGYGFTLHDECAAWNAQDRLHGGLARFAFATEIYGVNAARAVTGEAPDLRAVLPTPSLGLWYSTPPSTMASRFPPAGGEMGTTRADRNVVSTRGRKQSAGRAGCTTRPPASATPCGGDNRPSFR